MKLRNQADEVDTEPENEATVEEISHEADFKIKTSRKNRFTKHYQETQEISEIARWIEQSGENNFNTNQKQDYYQDLRQDDRSQEAPLAPRIINTRNPTKATRGIGLTQDYQTHYQCSEENCSDFENDYFDINSISHESKQ